MHTRGEEKLYLDEIMYTYTGEIITKHTGKQPITICILGIK